MIALPIVLSALYEVDELSQTATLRIRCHNGVVVTTLIHERYEHHPLTYDLVGTTTSVPITVFNRETLTLLCKVEEVVVASAVFQVNLALPEQIVALLVPCAASYLLLEQHEGSIAELASSDLAAIAERITGNLERIGGRGC